MQSLHDVIPIVFLGLAFVFICGNSWWTSRKTLALRERQTDMLERIVKALERS